MSTMQSSNTIFISHFMYIDAPNQSGYIQSKKSNENHSKGKYDTSLTMNFNMFENFPTAGTPSGFSNATNVCPGESYGRDLKGLDATSENSSASEASTITTT